MNAKEYLGQAYRLDQQINSKLEQAEMLRSLTQKVTATYGGEVVSHTRRVTSHEDIIVRLIEAEEDLNRAVDQLIDLKAEISRLIGQVQNASYRMILEKRYLCYKSWDQIADDMQYTRRWLLTKHERALAEIQKLLAEKGATA